MKNKKKLKGKDLINIGIYAAIYCVIMTAVAMLGFISDHDAAFMCDCPNIWRYSIYAFFDKS